MVERSLKRPLQRSTNASDVSGPTLTGMLSPRPPPPHLPPGALLLLSTGCRGSGPPLRKAWSSPPCCGSSAMPWALRHVVGPLASESSPCPVRHRGCIQRCFEAPWVAMPRKHQHADTHTVGLRVFGDCSDLRTCGRPPGPRRGSVLTPPPPANVRGGRAGKCARLMSRAVNKIDGMT